MGAKHDLKFRGRITASSRQEDEDEELVWSYRKSRVKRRLEIWSIVHTTPPSYSYGDNFDSAVNAQSELL